MFLDDIKAELTDMRAMLEALEQGYQGGHLHLGGPFDGRHEAKMHDLRRKIAVNQSILDRASTNGSHTDDMADSRSILDSDLLSTRDASASICDERRR